MSSPPSASEPVTPVVPAAAAAASETGGGTSVKAVKLKVLYLFAGEHRKSGVRAVMDQILGRRESKAWRRLFEIEVVCEEWDILRSDACDLSVPQVQDELDKRVAAGEFDFVLMSPPCNSWSRVLFANGWGPCAIRTAEWPWGFPWLSDKNSKRAEAGNCLVEFCLRLLNTALEASAAGKKVRCFWEHPEDLGALRHKGEVLRPASVWQLEDLRSQVSPETGRKTRVFRQCSFDAPYEKPTRVVTDIEAIAAWGYDGWPVFDSAGWYVGPLPKSCGHSDHVSLAKASAGEAFRTTGTSAYPPLMDLAIAEAIIDTFVGDLMSQTGAEVQGDGVATVMRPVGGVVTPHPAASKGSSWPAKAARASTSAQATQAQEVSAPFRASTSELVTQASGEAPSTWAQADGGSSSSSTWAQASQTRGGRGPPIKVTYKSGTRSLHDGGGLCSPGRWPPERRQLPGASNDAVRSAFTHGLRCWQKRLLGAPGGESRAFAELACGRLRSAPCQVEAVEVGLAVDQILQDRGFEPGRLSTDRATLINFRRMSAALKLMGDPDADFLVDIAADGVPIGVDVELPRTPDVFEEKVKWPLEPEESDTAEFWGGENYESALLHMADIRRQVDEDVLAGAAVRMSVAAAKLKYGNRLTIACLGAVPKEPGSEIVRILYDGTNGVHTNNRIRVRDRARCPMIEHLEALLREVEDSGCGDSHFVIVYDIAKAHRLVPVREADWGLQAFQLAGREEDKDEVVMYCCGTFGIASAAYWWARVSAAMVRLLHYCLGLHWAIWHLLYADDGLGIAKGSSCRESFMLLFLILETFGFPVAWRKVRAGTQLDWIGYHLDVSSFEVGINERKKAWLLAWLDGRLREGGVVGRNLRATLGRFCFVARTMDQIRPFLGPVFAWSAVLHPSAFHYMPEAIAVLLLWIRSKVADMATRHCRPLRVDTGEVFRVDAKAEGDLVVVGGWESYGGCLPEDARWFSVQLTKVSAPWAFSKGEPFRTIAALELLGALLAFMLFKDGAPWLQGSSYFCITGYTDNSSNSYLMDKLMTSKFPLIVVLMELAEQLAEANVGMALRWIPRLQNEEADALTNGAFEGFAAERRIEVSISELPFKVLGSMMSQVSALMTEINVLKSNAQSSHVECRTPFVKKPKLRESDPW